MNNEQIDIMIELIEDYKDVLDSNYSGSISDSEEELLIYLKRRQALNIDSVVVTEGELCGKSNCNRPKLDGNVYCSYHYEINFG